MTWILHSVIEVSGDPKGQPRPQAFSRGGKAAVYDPGTAEGWKALIALAARDHLPAVPLSGPVRVDAEFYFRRPQRLQKKNSPSGFIPHIARPDIDNCYKAAADCLTQIGFFQDDASIVETTIRKRYTRIDSAPGALIEVYTWSN